MSDELHSACEDNCSEMWENQGCRGAVPLGESRGSSSPGGWAARSNKRYCRAVRRHYHPVKELVLLSRKAGSTPGSSQ